MLIAAPGHTHRSPWRGRRSFAAYYRCVDDALRTARTIIACATQHSSDCPACIAWLASALAVAPSPTCMRPGAPSEAIERASAVLTARQVLALQLCCEGQPMVSIASRPDWRSRQYLRAAYWRPTVEAVTPMILIETITHILKLSACHLSRTMCVLNRLSRTKALGSGQV